MEWLRWYHGTHSDTKLRLVAARAREPVHVVVAVWAAMLENASESSGRGTLERFDAEVAGAALDLEPERVEAVRKAMQGKLLDGDRVTAWERRQVKREDPSRERVQRYRERKAEEKRAVTQRNAPEKIRVEEKRGDTEQTGGKVPLEAPHARANGKPAPQPESDDVEQREAARGDGQAPTATSIAPAGPAAGRSELGVPDSPAGSRLDAGGSHVGLRTTDGGGRSAVLSAEQTTLAALQRDFATLKASVVAPKAPEPVRVNLALPGAIVGEVEEAPEHFTAEQVVILWAKQQKFRPDAESARRQMDAARWLAKHPAEHVTRALYGIGYVFPFSKGEAWELKDVRLKWTQALQESEKHPALVDARTANAIKARMSGGGNG